MKEKKGKGKIIFGFVIVIILAVVVFCLYLWDKENASKMKDAMKKPALDYFDKYMSSNTGSSAYKVTLKDLKNANSEEGETYNLSTLDKCEDNTTYATISIDYGTGKVTGINFKLDCKKI